MTAHHISNARSALVYFLPLFDFVDIHVRQSTPLLSVSAHRLVCLLLEVTCKHGGRVPQEGLWI